MRINSKSAGRQSGVGLAAGLAKRFAAIGILSAVLTTAASAQDDSSNEATFAATGEMGLLELEAYWTAKRMEDAQPLPLPERSENEFVEQFGQEAQMFDEQDSDVIVEPAGAEEVAGTPQRADVNAYPYSTSGKLFFTLNGSNYTCSAAFVSSTVILTAAHCVRAVNGTWATRVLFRRAYSNGGGQSVGYRCFGTKRGWVTGGSNRYKWDYAFIKASSPSTGKNLGLRTGIPYSSWESTGYPGNFGGGRYMYKVTGKKGRVANGVVEMLGNPMTFGSSGGSWIGGNRYAIGVNSHIYRNRPGRMYGPYFDGNVGNLYGFVNNGCR